MAASIGWYDTDDTTVLASIDLGAVPPGQDYYTRNSDAYKEVRAKNDGTVDFASVDVEIQQAGSYGAYTYLRIAKDAGAGSPGTFQAEGAGALSLGALAADASASVWIDAIVGSGEDPEEGQVANLVLTASV